MEQHAALPEFFFRNNLQDCQVEGKGQRVEAKGGWWDGGMQGDDLRWNSTVFF